MSELVEVVLDPAIEALIAKLPVAGEVWSTQARRRWLRAVESIFDLLYEENAPLPTFQIVLSEEPHKTPAVDIAEEASEEIASEETVEEESEPDEIPAFISAKRPEGIPSVFEMIRTVLTEKPGLTSSDLHAEIVKRWWPGLTRDRLGPDISTGIRDRRISRDDCGRMSITQFGSELETRPVRKLPPPRREYDTPLSPTPTKVEGEQPAATLSGVKLFAFVYKDRTVMLPKGELEMANALRRVMGKGFLDYAFLGLRGRGTSQSRAAVPDRSWLSQTIPPLAAKVKPLGLEILHTENFGYFMKEIEA